MLIISWKDVQLFACFNCIYIMLTWLNILALMLLLFFRHWNPFMRSLILILSISGRKLVKCCRERMTWMKLCRFGVLFSFEYILFTVSERREKRLLAESKLFSMLLIGMIKSLYITTLRWVCSELFQIYEFILVLHFKMPEWNKWNKDLKKLHSDQGRPWIYYIFMIDYFDACS